jgi:hypothetical protein
VEGVFLLYQFTKRVTKLEYLLGKKISPLHVVQTKSRAYPASYPMCIGGVLSPGLGWPRLEADHSPPASAEVQKIWMCTSTPIRLHGVVSN